MANPDDLLSQQAFDRLLESAGAPETLGGAIRSWITGKAVAANGVYLARDPGIRPPGGTVVTLDALRPVAGMTAERLDRLSAVMAGLEAEGGTNINSAPVAVLRAMLPTLRPAEIDELVALRRQTPFASAEEFLAYLQASVGEDRFGEIAAERFGVTSDWIELSLTASLGDDRISRQVIFRRFGETRRARVEFRAAVDPLADLR